MKEKLHKPLFLFKLLGFFLFLLGIHRVIFLILFLAQFSDVSFIEFVKAFLIGTLTDAISIIYFLLPMWIVLLLFNIENKIVKIVSLLMFLFGFTILCILNLADLGYYPITKKRMGAELLDLLPETKSLFSSYLKDYWYLFVLLILFIGCAFWVFKKMLYEYKNSGQKPVQKILNATVVILLFVVIMRGGFSERPFMPFDIPSVVNPKLQWLASNTPFQFLHTLEDETIKIENYYDELEAEKIIGFENQLLIRNLKEEHFIYYSRTVLAQNVLEF